MYDFLKNGLTYRDFTLAEVKPANAPVVGMLGATASSMNIALKEAFAKLKLPCISSSSTSPELSDNSQHPWFSRTVASDAANAAALAHFIKSINVERIGVLSDTSSFGKSVKSQFEETYQTVFGRQVTVGGSFPPIA